MKQKFKDWRSQFVTSNKDKMGLRYTPFAFTEDGVAQLSTVLSSERAIKVNIQIIRLHRECTVNKTLVWRRNMEIRLNKMASVIDVETWCQSNRLREKYKIIHYQPYIEYPFSLNNLKKSSL